MDRAAAENFIRRFWSKLSFFNILFAPFSLLYLLGFYIKKLFTTTYKINAFVICVGNLCVGGSGKTSFCISLIQKLRSAGYKDISVVSKGYGRKSKGAPFLVTPGMDPVMCGDEPLLLAEYAPVYVGDTRFEASRLAIESGAKILILDDGLQDDTIAKDFTFCLRSELYSNPLPLPAGPMRELEFFAKSKIDVFSDELETKTSFELEREIKGNKCVAFCGIGNPYSFRSALSKLDYEIAAFHSFPDHHVYTDADIEMLEQYNLPLVTTKKDYVKLPYDFASKVVLLQKTIEIVALPSLLSRKIVMR